MSDLVVNVSRWLISLALTGPGRFSVDQLLVRRGVVRSREFAHVVAADAAR